MTASGAASNQSARETPSGPELEGTVTLTVEFRE